ncbi:MAG: zf-TFIIB domain-containing protein [Phycisphaerales bacterium]|nr:MAG: zf-TFIIB domain-containing protein [Phycisphaerales bacterium]
MECPACGNSLKEVTVEGITVDVCEGGCGGIWFDWFELQKVDEPHESAGEGLLEVERDEGVSVDRSKRLDCPKCDGIVMMRHFFSVKHEVEVDECPGCGGFWLDAGELGKIRSLFESEQERHEAADKYFSDLFAADFAAMEEENRAKLEKTRKVAKMFRFVCPSYYVPGKQAWGAF